MGHAKGAYWYGSRLSIEETRAARSLQQRHLAAGHRGGAGRHGLGDREPARRHRRGRTTWITCAACRSPGPYLGEVVGVYSDWTPLAGRGVLFPESVDPDLPLAVQELPRAVATRARRTTDR